MLHAPFLKVQIQTVLYETSTYFVKIETDSGTMVVKLSEKTPQTTANFLKLVKEHFYDGLLFHRVIKGFMIQGGDPDSKNAAPGQVLGEGGLKYTVPAEFDTSLFHQKGAIAMARESDDVNPKESQQLNSILYCRRTNFYGC